ncbi:S1-C subfamily serine protease [Paenibacillus castaneae]|uniref:S1C family serine protease n=1 Tax=Paenibacillus castaneae TaxID=474957 RepID=UPI000C99FF3A|nr:trypsin-like peptidase domain-containing protein [Paenibacillus castaneae]NIK79060.1 S1-C subfamily serine protease [Paenibacillus castaneae]
MNEDNKRAADYDNQSTANSTPSSNSTPVTTYIYESRKSTNELRESYEKELGLNMDLMQPSMGGSKRSKRGGSSARTMLASFLIGAVVIGGLSYAADKNNLFTGAKPQSSGSNIVNGSAQQDSGLSTVSLNTSDDVASIYAAASPAVVKIENYGAAAQSSSILDDPTFGQFFGGGQSGRGGRQQEQQGGSTELELSGTGSGFFFDKTGYILTNEHVISGAKQVKVTVQGYDQPLVATVLGSSYDLDLAVLKVDNPDGKAFPSLKLGSSDETNIGEWVIAIGNPYGLDHTLTMGVLSAKERPITISDEKGEHQYEHLLQTDASINPGNSGGPLLNAKGEVIGINTAVNAEAQGMGFAIPTTTITNVLEKLKTNTL